MNPAQAWLCYENAEFYCTNEEDACIIAKFKENIACVLKAPVRKLSIVILSYNDLDMTKACIESIRKNNAPLSYDLILLDNASEDGSKEWLMEQDDLKLICNTENMGFPYACNQGIKAADPDTDIFLSNNDTVVALNSVFWLRMGLYSEERVGATGSMSNRVSNYQRVDDCGLTVEECMQYAALHNMPMEHPYERKLFLISFALMIKREAMDEIGLLDIRFSPGTYEDNDYGMRLRNAGWEVLLCKNSFIYHNKQIQDNAALWRNIRLTNSDKFSDKWHFDINYYSYARTELIEFIKEECDIPISVLEVGCGLGSTLLMIQSMWHNANVHGIELEPEVARTASTYIDVIQGNAETMEIPYRTASFDYIILGDVLEHLIHPRDMLLRFIPYLKPTGKFICSIPNLMHTSVIFPLLFEGKFEYKDAGILDRTHLRFFTLESIIDLFQSCRLEIQEIRGVPSITPENEKRLDTMMKMLNLPPKQQFLIYQYIFCAQVK